MTNHGFRQKLRIVLAIAAKDTLDALKNRTILSLTFGVLMLLLSGKALPLLLAARGTPTLAVYDPAGSLPVETFAGQGDLRVIPVDSQEEMESLLLDSQQLIIGLVVPPDLEPDSGEVVLAGYTPHWANPSTVRAQVTLFEEALGAASGTPVRIEVEGHRLYPSVDSGLSLAMATQTASLMIMLMGLMLVPYLFLEEKEHHTLDALLISPASFGQLVAGKAIAGAVYCLIAALVVLAFNFRLIVHWDLALLAILLGSSFAVMIGLLLGTLVENQASLAMWIGAAILILFGPAFLTTFNLLKGSSALERIFAWTPGAAFNDLLKLSMCGDVPAGPVWQGTAVLALGAVLSYILVVWRVRRLDR